MGLIGVAASVATTIEAEIASMAPGDRLPTEREWAERTGQSRSTVRQALVALEARGLILRQVGRGTFVAPRSADTWDTTGAAGSSPEEIMSVRLLVEPSAMPLAARAARASDLAEIERCLQGGEEHVDYEAFEQWDSAFHRALAEATHNGLLVHICDLLNSARNDPSWGRLKRRSFTAQRRLEYGQDHREIARALESRDGAAAEQAMRTHLQRVHRYLLED